MTAENAGLRSELGIALERQAVTAQILNVISMSRTDVQAVFDVISESSRRLLGSQTALVTRVMDGMLHLAACTAGSPASHDEIRSSFPTPSTSSGIHSRVALSSVMAFRSDIETERGIPHAVKAMARIRGYRSIVVVPMLCDGVAIGTIGVSRAEPGTFSVSQIDLLKTFADQAVIAIENARLFEELQERTRQLSKSLDDLSAAQDRLVQTEKLASLGQLTAGIAHEIKNPLNFVNNFAALSAELMDELSDTIGPLALSDNVRDELEELGGLLKDNLQKIVQHGKRADSIVKNMLLHSRGGGVREARRRQAEAERAHASLSRYFSPELAKRLSTGGNDDDMQVRWRDIAVIFTDITSFTALVETAAPEVLAKLLNEYVGGLTDVVFAHEGTVAKVIGDTIQVLFNAPGDQPDYATRAIACAQALDQRAEAFRERWKQKGVDFGVTRIGVHAGPALVGNFGGDRFFDFTAYGDTVNTAARLEAANKTLGTQICVSESVANAAEEFRGRPIGDLVLRGRSQSLRAFEPLSAAKFDGLDVAQYTEAFTKLELDHAAAIPAFAALVGAHADDPLASYHLRRLLNGAKGICIQIG
ncbi:class 3 adenylate cyclase/GAF domain-containing protein [Rhizobium tropici]|nr:class 3 adenylate cyclase/GAF domain-containing protein [Rhizobium tropici]